MERKGIERFAPLTGVLFLVLAVVALILAGDPPDTDEEALKHVEFFEDKEGAQLASAILATYAAVMLVWFAGSLRDAIARVEPGTSRLASIAFGGAIMTATGGCVANAIQFAATDTAGKVSADTTQTLSVLYQLFFFPMAAGLALLLLASGLAALRHGAFDRILGWIAIGLAVIAITPAGFVAFIGSLAWVALTGVMLYRKTDPVGSGAVDPPPQAPA